MIMDKLLPVTKGGDVIGRLRGEDNDDKNWD
jgi:hypothetical protein